MPAINEISKVAASKSSTRRKTKEISRQKSSWRDSFYNSKERPKHICEQKIANETVWTSLVCNENLNLIITYAKGMGSDFFWPPSHERGLKTYADTIANRSVVEESYANECSDLTGIYGFPKKEKADPSSKFLDDYYGGLRIGFHSNIIFSNGLLDPWAAAGVYNQEIEFDMSRSHLCKHGGVSHP